MLRFMDWSVVAMGGALVFAGLGSRWRERPGVREGRSPGQGVRFFRPWLHILMGVGVISARLPSLLAAPHVVVMIMDPLSGVLWVAVLILVLRAAYHVSRARRPRALD